MQLENFSIAEKIYRNLLKRNPENHMYYEAIEKCTSALKQIKNCELFYCFSITIFLQMMFVVCAND